MVHSSPTRPTDTVGSVAGSLVAGMLDGSDFGGWNDIPRSGEPVRLSHVENSSASGSELRHISPGAAEETVDGGPKDSGA